MKRKMAVIHILDGGSVPFKLIETNMTSDGLRSRLCDGAWKTKEEAEKEMEVRLARID